METLKSREFVDSKWTDTNLDYYTKQNIQLQ